MATPLHIAASLKVFRKHLGRPTTVAFARDRVKELALKAGTATELAAERKLREDLERATRVGIADLAVIAEEWV